MWERALTAGRVEGERATVRRQLVVHASSGKEKTQLAERRGEVEDLAQTAAFLRNCDITRVEHARSVNLPCRSLGWWLPEIRVPVSHGRRSQADIGRKCVQCRRAAAHMGVLISAKISRSTCRETRARC